MYQMTNLVKNKKSNKKTFPMTEQKITLPFKLEPWQESFVELHNRLFKLETFVNIPKPDQQVPEQVPESSEVQMS